MSLSPERKALRRAHIVAAAHDLIRDEGPGGFTMGKLAERANVSPATPYNLIGPLAEVVRLVVDDEFDRFAQRLSAEARPAGLDGLLRAVDLMVAHYGADPDYYRALFGMIFRNETPELVLLMRAAGRDLWGGLIAAAIARGDLDAGAGGEAFTDAFVRTLAMVTFVWTTDDVSQKRYALEMAYAARLALAAFVTTDRRPVFAADVDAISAQLA